MKKNTLLNSYGSFMKNRFFPQIIFNNQKNNKLKADYDIMNDFVFNEEENNIIGISFNNLNSYLEEYAKPKKIKVKYNICSFFSSPIRPDLYCPLGYISGKKYELIKSNDTIKEEIKEVKNEEEDIISISSFDSFEEEERKINSHKIERYFHIEEDISSKCSICGKIGHKRKKCPYQLKFCCRCCNIGHDDNDEKKCSKKQKCFRCNKYGHTSTECIIKENELIICGECGCIGHISSDCLRKSGEISVFYLNCNKLACRKCGSYEHLLCSIVDRKLPIIKKDQDNEISLGEDYLFTLLKLEEDEGEICQESILKSNLNIKNEDFKEVIFCGFCGGMHRNEQCIFKNQFIYKFDEIRKNEGKILLEKRNKNKKEKKIKFSMKNSEDSSLTFDTDNNITETISLNEEDENDNGHRFFSIDIKQKKKKKSKKKNKHKNRQKNLNNKFEKYGNADKAFNINENNERKDIQIPKRIISY